MSPFSIVAFFTFLPLTLLKRETVVNINLEESLEIMKTIKKFTCIQCLEEVDVYTEKDTNPLFLCDICILYEKTKHTILVNLDGSPRGYVRGSRNRVRQ